MAQQRARDFIRGCSNYQFSPSHSRNYTARLAKRSQAKAAESKSITLGATFPPARYLAAGNDALSPFCLVW